jgi:hypothetical protein
MVDQRSISSTLTENIKTAATGINSLVTAPVCNKYAVLVTTYAELQSKTCCKKTTARSLFLVHALDSFSTGSLRMSFRPILGILDVLVVIGSGQKYLSHPPKALSQPRQHHVCTLSSHGGGTLKGQAGVGIA